MTGNLNSTGLPPTPVEMPLPLQLEPPPLPPWNPYFLPPSLLPSPLPRPQSTPLRKTTELRYHLRSRSVIKEDPQESGSLLTLGKGLGSLPQSHSVGKGRGRKSHLYLAQDRARIDLASGRQSSIEWVLREKLPQDGVTS
jgi:hypothetical protein